ncbi:hypothetical protein [Pantoea agglomerans]|uniref:hypothetical protein n=1 Tax=Enterobacter agglomerans TaxID=549 RepID=UPI0011E5CB13|nr:hypothetical protein [Pantoea agglomerans]
MPAEVFFHNKFKGSTARTTFFSDYLALLPSEDNLLSDFIIKVKLGMDLEGRNKSSWTDTNDAEMKSLKLTSYKLCKLWHYHAGPFTGLGSFTSKNVRMTNLSGQTSAAVVHYKWYDSAQTKLVIIAFSPVHKPFPGANDVGNPLSLRSGLLLSNDLIPA